MMEKNHGFWDKVDQDMKVKYQLAAHKKGTGLVFNFFFYQQSLQVVLVHVSSQSQSILLLNVGLGVGKVLRYR